MSSLENNTSTGQSTPELPTWELGAAEIANQKIGNIEADVDETAKLDRVNRIIKDFIHEASYIRDFSKCSSVYSDHIVDKKNYKIVGVISGLEDYVYGIQQLPDNRLMTLRADGQLLLWTQKDSVWNSQNVEAELGVSRQFQYLPNNKIASITAEFALSIRTLGDNNSVPEKVTNNSPRVDCFAVLPSKQIVTAHGDNSIRISQKEDGVWVGESIKGKIEGLGPIHCVHAFPDGRIVAGSESGVVFVFKKEKDEWSVQLLEGHKAAVYCIQTSKDGKIVTGSADRTIRVWSNIDGHWQSEKLAKHKGTVFCLQVLPNNTIVSGSGDNTIRIWNKGSEHWGSKVLRGHTNGIFCLSVLPDGKIISGAADKTIILWDGTPRMSR